MTCATRDALKQAANIQAQATKLASESHLTAKSQASPIICIFSRKGVSPDVAEDIMTFCSIGQNEFERFVEYNILQPPSVPKHWKRLCTFSERKALAKRVSDVEKLQTECCKKRMAFACNTRRVIGNTFQQYTELPHALVDKDGLPQKGQKSSITQLIESR